MRISKKVEYALLAMIDLALHHGVSVRRVHEIAGKEDIPLNFLENILLMLKRSGLVQSKRGMSGGYFLAAHPDKITLGSIMRLIDNSLSPMECTGGELNSSCNKEEACGLRSVMIDVNNAVSQVLDHVTLSDICNRINGNIERRQEQVMYYI